MGGERLCSRKCEVDNGAAVVPAVVYKSSCRMASLRFLFEGESLPFDAVDFDFYTKEPLPETSLFELSHWAYERMLSGIFGPSTPRFCPCDLAHYRLFEAVILDTPVRLNREDWDCETDGYFVEMTCEEKHGMV